MFLKALTLQNFRNYSRSSFNFSILTIIVGKNTIGKTNILEAIYSLSHGKSFKAEKDADVIQFENNFAKVTGIVESDDDRKTLEVIFMQKDRFLKKFTLNQIPKRQADFISNLITVIFTPSDIEIITGSPTLRRNYIDSILIQANKSYRIALLIYEKALKMRNRLLRFVKEGKKQYQEVEFEYWNNLLVEHGAKLTKEREQFIEYINSHLKEIYDFSLFYDKSTITYARILKYHEAEIQSGITLIGPQRDDFIFFLGSTDRKVSEFSSRGEQRLTILQMKFLEIEFLKSETGANPLLLLDDIFSELDDENINRVLKFVGQSQTIITTTHKEFIPKKLKLDLSVIEL